MKAASRIVLAVLAALSLAASAAASAMSTQATSPGHVTTHNQIAAHGAHKIAPSGHMKSAAYAPHLTSAGLGG